MTTNKPEPIDDAIFFHKGRVGVGTTLVCMGRLDPRSQWVVTRIKSYTPAGKGVFKCKHVKHVQHLSDEIEMRNVGDNRRRHASFAYLSYSAIWRLV